MIELLYDKKYFKRLCKELRRHPVSKNELLKSYVERKLGHPISPDMSPASSNILRNSSALSESSRIQALYSEAEQVIEDARAKGFIKSSTSKAAYLNVNWKSVGWAKPFIKARQIITSSVSRINSSFLPFPLLLTQHIISTLKNKVKRSEGSLARRCSLTEKVLYSCSNKNGRTKCRKMQIYDGYSK